MLTPHTRPYINTHKNRQDTKIVGLGLPKKRNMAAALYIYDRDYGEKLNKNKMFKISSKSPVYEEKYKKKMFKKLLETDGCQLSTFKC